MATGQMATGVFAVNCILRILLTAIDQAGAARLTASGSMRA